MAHIQAILVITLLTWAAVSVFGTTPEISTTTGDTVKIPCVFGEGTLRNIFWYYNNGTGPQKILFLSKGVLAIDPKYADRASIHSDNSTLILKDIVVADEGTYRCDVDRQGQTPVPNINTKLNVFSLRPDTLPVIKYCTGADESSPCIAHANQSFTLTCTLSNVYPVEDTELIWYQDGKRVSSTDGVMHNAEGTTNISRQIQVSETGNFTCNATYLTVNGKENTAASVEACIILPVDVPNTPEKNLTSGQIAGITIVLLVCISLTIMTLFIYRRKRRGFIPVQKDDTGNTQPDKEKRSRFNKGTPMANSLTDERLRELAEDLAVDTNLPKLGLKLGFKQNKVDMYMGMNKRNGNYDGTSAMLFDWKKKTSRKKHIPDLKKALIASGLTSFAEEFFPEEAGDGDPPKPQSRNDDSQIVQER